MITGLLVVLSFYFSLYYSYKVKKFGLGELFRNMIPGFKIPPYFKFIKKVEFHQNGIAETELNFINRKRANIFLLTCYLLIVIN